PSPARPGTSGRNPQQSSRQRRPVAETAALAAQLEAENPELSQAELAERLGISASRLRAIRREVRELERAA
ncbi:MAG: winged helix-turn-helix domain-containing protein, partial [Micromonosporaceae bacterium]|nr:winged helix-turn-helix domain-containing protein [Micromonosporaceae bacterium]